MPDRRAVALARRLAPPSLRRDAFDPAVRDLVRAVGRDRALSWRLAALVADCWRLWLVALVRPDSRRLRLWPQHVRYALRRWRADPAFPLTTVALLALGIGAVTTVFSIAHALVLRPLPYPDPDRLVAVWPGQFLANREIDALDARARSYTALTAFSPGWLMPLTGVAVAQQLDVERVSANYFSLFGVTPIAGRAFDRDAEIPGHDHVVVLSEPLWEAQFGRDPSIVGRSIRLGGDAYLVVGVMPRSLRVLDTKADAWTPWTTDRSDWTWTKPAATVFGRLASSVTPATASIELRTLTQQMQQPFQHAPAWSATATVAPLKEVLVGDTRGTLATLLSAVGFLLLIAVANVGNLLSIRLADRRSELALRSSLGASTRQLRGLLVVESTILVVVAAFAGLGIAAAALAQVRYALPADLPRVDEIRLDPVAGGLVAAVLGFVVIALSLIPTAQSVAAAAAPYLRAGRTQTRRTARSRGVLIALEIALAVVLSSGATLMGRTLVALHRVNPGLRADHLLTMKVQPTGTEASVRTYWQTVLERVSAVPGVQSAATILHLPTSGRSWQADLAVAGRPRPAEGEAVRASWESISVGYFGTAGQPILAGRPFTAADGPTAPLVIAIDTTVAARLFPGQQPIGQRLTAGNATDGAEATIVAVVGPVHYDNLADPPGPEVYVPFLQRPVFANSLVVRTATTPGAVAASIVDSIRRVDRDVPITEVRTMDDRLAASIDAPRFISITLGMFAVTGLLLAAVGIYSVVAFGVRQRERELGIRAALGADTWRIRRLVVGEGARFVTLGLATGIPTALVLATSMRELLFGVPAADPWSFGLVAVVVASVAFVATLAPAWRASAANPVDVLRR
jgi:putative ABC transport system permease protein